MKGRPVRAATINDAPAPTTLHIALVNVEEVNRNIHSISTQLPILKFQSLRKRFFPCLHLSLLSFAILALH